MNVINSPRSYIEVPVFLLFLVYGLDESVYPNMILYRSCYVSLGYNRSDCALLGSHKKSNMTDYLETIVQPYSTHITMAKEVVTTLASAFLNLFVGSWSDKCGRKPILITSLIGLSLGHVITTMISFFGNVSPWFYTLSTIPLLCLGGGGAFTTLAFLFIADITTEENRAIRMVFTECVRRVGKLIGIISSSYLLDVVGYIGVFAICSAIVFLAVLYTLFFISETIEKNEQKVHFKELLSSSNITDSIATTFKRRENNARTLVWVCSLLTVILAFHFYGDLQMMHLYLRRQFGWSVRKWTHYVTVTDIVKTVGALLGIYVFNKLFRMHEITVLFISCFPLVVSALLRALGTEDLHIYIAAAVECFSGVFWPTIKSLMSKLVLKEEVGKILSINTTLDMIGNLISSSVYRLVYKQTINDTPGAYNYISASFWTLGVILTMYACFTNILPRTSNKVADESKVQKQNCQVETKPK